MVTVYSLFNAWRFLCVLTSYVLLSSHSTKQPLVDQQNVYKASYHGWMITSLVTLLVQALYFYTLAITKAI